MSIWLRYLAIAVLIDNGFETLWHSIALGRVILGALPGVGIERLLLGLTFSVAAIALAALIAAPTQYGVSLRTKIIAIPSVLSGGLGVLSSAMLLYTRASQPQIGLLTDSVSNLLITERALRGGFFSACTLALAILVLASRRSSA
jgi:hypothetical protein